MQSRSRYVLSVLLFAALLAPAASFAAPPQFVAVGDVHGAFDNFIAVLQKTGLIDQAHHWTGGGITLVQVGDLLDRGPKPREAMDLLMELEPEAPKAGGRVVVLLGNHEIMNLMGDLRYVTVEDYAEYADAKSADRRQSAWQEFSKWRNKHGELAAELPASFNATEEQWMATHPLGFVEQREAFSPTGKYGKWLRSHSTVARIDAIVFLHGGLDPTVAALGINAINSRIHDEINVFDSTRKYLQEQQLILPFFTMQEMTAVVKARIHLEEKKGVPLTNQLQSVIAPFMQFGSWLSMSADSPVWFRGYDEWTDAEGAPQVTKVLQSCQAKSIVVGHTPQKNGRIRPRFDDRVFLIDTGMLNTYFPGGRPSALEIGHDGEIAAQYLDERIVLHPAVSSQGATAGSAAIPVSGKN